jgi:hypothetical protein
MIEWRVLAFAALLTAGAVSGQTSSPPAGAAPKVTARTAARLLDQASWGPTPLAIAEVQNAGVQSWLATQFQLNTSTLPDQQMSVSEPAGSDSPEPLLAFRSATRMANIHCARTFADRMGRPRGGLH